MEMERSGVLRRFGVRNLGADAGVIRRAEDRQAFKELLAQIGEPMPPSHVCQSLTEAQEFAAEVGLPLVVRPAYTLGGTGGGFVTTEAELARVVLGGISASPIGQVLVERSLWGWEEIRNEVTGRTYAAFEPALDYVVVKIPRWPFDKFPGADRRLGTQMKSTGEVMAIERTFEGALAKALRSLEQRVPSPSDLEDPSLIEEPNDRRLFALMHALGRGATPAELARRSGIDPWFLERIQAMLEEPAAEGPLTYKLVDTCAAEFEAVTPYYYSCREEESEAVREPGRSALVGGSRPIRIGQGIAVGYCSGHAAWAPREAGGGGGLARAHP